MLGDNIRTQRLIKRLKQEFVAQQAGISQASYSRYEQGKSDPRFGTMVGIAKGIGCSVRDFLDPEL